MPRPARIGLLGAGLIGTEHARTLARIDETELVAVADPSDAGRALAAELGVAHHDDYRALLAAGGVDGVVAALPNRMHADAAVAAIEHGVAVLVEKPIAGTLDEARWITEAADRTGVPVLVGHQRRYAPDVVAAKALLDSGALGEIVSVGILSTWRKHDSYFDVDWRRTAGGGPVLINLIHDLDAIRHLVGEIDSVVALGGHTRGFEVADTVGAVLRFVGGALGTALVSDASAAPWNWDLTSGYGAYFPPPPPPPGDVYFLSGTRAALSLPSLTLFTHDGDADWRSPMRTRVVERVEADAYTEQLRHFADVALRRCPPLIDAHDGTRTLAVAHAVEQAQQTGTTIHIDEEIAV
ncbi:Gfo/Idh/MocA family oxidoreductase [Pseudonocardia nematodicida]|uniref:Gfo/Idh/MocA family oxidoreductase n=1 Tax=Pseudonocardia nematodicida TaxID=1206997 RepID=A0ABV1K4A1_9PSEU